MKFGSAVITLKVRSKDSGPDEYGEYSVAEDEVELPWCRHRPLTFQETAELEMDIATQPWRSTIPLHEYDDTLIAAALSLKPTDVIEVNGQQYQVIGGIRPHDDINGNPFKATIISQKQIG